MSRLVSSNQGESNMQRSVLNRATMRVADTTAVSGRVTADSINTGYSVKNKIVSGTGTPAGNNPNRSSWTHRA